VPYWLGALPSAQPKVSSDRSICNNLYCMIGICLLMAEDESCMAGGESRMTGDCCPPEGSIHGCVRTHSYLYSHIYVAL